MTKRPTACRDVFKTSTRIRLAADGAKVAGQEIDIAGRASGAELESCDEFHRTVQSVQPRVVEEMPSGGSEIDLHSSVGGWLSSFKTKTGASDS